MVKCLIPKEQLEPWHAVFIPVPGIADSPYMAASKYGSALVELGLVDNYYLIGYARGGEIIYHCIPPSPGKSAADYWKKIFDGNY